VRLETSVREASDVASLPDGRFAIVSDRGSAVKLFDRRGNTESLRLPGVRGESQFEAVAYAPEREELILSREESRELLRYAWAPSARRAQLDKRLEVDLRGRENKGIEGLAFLPKRFSPTGADQLVAAKEGDPRQLLLLGPGGGRRPIEVKLSDAIRDQLKDFSGLAVDPKSGDLFVSSDESATVAQLQLRKVRGEVQAELVVAHRLFGPDGPLPRIEGLTFDAMRGFSARKKRSRREVATGSSPAPASFATARPTSCSCKACPGVRGSPPPACQG
jgi:uncharacterized protein YjiK